MFGYLVPMPPVTFFDVPGAAIAALLIAAVFRWAYRGGNVRGWPMACLVAALAALAIWRMFKMTDAPTAVDVVLGILAGLLIFNGIKAAWGDGPFDRMPRGEENTPMFVLLLTGAIGVGALLFTFGCAGGVLMACTDDGLRYAGDGVPTPYGWAWGDLTLYGFAALGLLMLLTGYLLNRRYFRAWEAARFQANRDVKEQSLIGPALACNLAGVVSLAAALLIWIF